MSATTSDMELASVDQRVVLAAVLALGYAGALALSALLRRTGPDARLTPLCYLFGHSAADDNVSAEHPNAPDQQAYDAYLKRLDSGIHSIETCRRCGRCFKAPFTPPF